ncbi:FecR family protein [Sphingomonas sp. Root241]|uniref:FecR family protein n=1 Tax=Sphingomonas sp. Root241 TaxID=1736501 RepID=UPI0006F6CC8E|nr:FecR domain-containing protein [Sphingomonas sp. Root241]KRC78137.1 iron dicitrate transport regulator FecR [Sphingomonas sp. Root241]
MQDRIEQQAAEWAVRHPLRRDEQAQLDDWLSQDERHGGALLRAMAGLSAIETALAAEADTDEPVHAEDAYRPTRRWLLGGGVGLTAAAAASVVLGWPRLIGQHITTARGEIRRLPLADGSVATINSDSDLRIVLAGDSRRVDLARGQAWFQVAKDRTRPFVVDAGIAQARAVGTAFSVVRGRDGVQVAVTEGVVAVWPSDSSGMMTILEAGQFANFKTAGAAPTIGSAPGEIERALAWRNGEIALENDSLSEAVASFNRYNRKQIVLTDQSLAEEKLVGLFKLDKPENFASMLGESLDLDVSVTSDEIRLARKNKINDDGNP